MHTVLTLLALWLGGGIAFCFCLNRACQASTPTPPVVPDHVPADWTNTCGCPRHAPASWVPDTVPDDLTGGAR